MIYEVVIPRFLGRIAQCFAWLPDPNKLQTLELSTVHCGSHVKQITCRVLRLDCLSRSLSMLRLVNENEFQRVSHSMRP